MCFKNSFWILFTGPSAIFSIEFVFIFQHRGDAELRSSCDTTKNIALQSYDTEAVSSNMSPLRQIVDGIWIYHNHVVTKAKIPEQKPFMPQKFKKI